MKKLYVVSIVWRGETGWQGLFTRQYWSHSEEEAFGLAYFGLENRIELLTDDTEKKKYTNWKVYMKQIIEIKYEKEPDINV